jgi:hypothetical protein
LWSRARIAALFFLYHRVLSAEGRPNNNKRKTLSQRFADFSVFNWRSLRLVGAIFFDFKKENRKFTP